jgi:hypothetical protein
VHATPVPATAPETSALIRTLNRVVDWAVCVVGVLDVPQPTAANTARSARLRLRILLNLLFSCRGKTAL